MCAFLLNVEHITPASQEEVMCIIHIDAAPSMDSDMLQDITKVVCHIRVKRLIVILLDYFSDMPVAQFFARFQPLSPSRMSRFN